jgi:hypothetical protein
MLCIRSNLKYVVGATTATLAGLVAWHLYRTPLMDLADDDTQSIEIRSETKLPSEISTAPAPECLVKDRVQEATVQVQTIATRGGGGGVIFITPLSPHSFFWGNRFSFRPPVCRLFVLLFLSCFLLHHHHHPSAASTAKCRLGSHGGSRVAVREDLPGLGHVHEPARSLGRLARTQQRGRQHGQSCHTVCIFTVLVYNLCMCMYLYLWVYIEIHRDIEICNHIYLYIYLYIMYMCVHISTNMVYVHTYIYTYTYIYIYILSTTPVFFVSASSQYLHPENLLLCPLLPLLLIWVS